MVEPSYDVWVVVCELNELSLTLLIVLLKLGWFKTCLLWYRLTNFSRSLYTLLSMFISLFVYNLPKHINTWDLLVGIFILLMISSDKSGIAVYETLLEFFPKSISFVVIVFRYDRPKIYKHLYYGLD